MHSVGLLAMMLPMVAAACGGSSQASRSTSDPVEAPTIQITGVSVTADGTATVEYSIDDDGPLHTSLDWGTGPRCRASAAGGARSRAATSTTP